MSNLFGYEVTRAIPSDVLYGLISGKFKAYGGVIRWAAGTEQAGQIVQHLIPVAGIPGYGIATAVASASSTLTGLVNTYQLRQLSRDVDALTAMTKHVLEATVVSGVLSGLSLAVGAAGFSWLNVKVNKLNDEVLNIKSDVVDIKNFLERQERALFKVALKDLQDSERLKDEKHRYDSIQSARKTVSTIREKYKEQLQQTKDVDAAFIFQDYYCLAGLAQARCRAELGQYELAYEDAVETYKTWVEQARSIAKNMLIARQPERFLYKEFARMASIHETTEWMDFAHDKEKGLQWIDELRMDNRVWYESFAIADIAKPSLKEAGQRVIEQREKVIPRLQYLVARNNVMLGLVSQYEFLMDNHIKPAEFEARIASLRQDSMDGFVLLKKV